MTFSRQSLVEAGLVLVILISGYAIGSQCHQAFRATGDKEDFGQYTFAAAVALACGHGFIDVQPLPPALDQFVKLKQDTFDCATLPADLPHLTPQMTQGLYRYLMTTVAAVWTVRGVSWSVLSPLFGLVYGATLAAAYGLFRLGMGRVIAMAMTAVLAASAIQLGYLPSLRDYAKAPFILGLILLMGRFVVGPLERRRALAIAAGFGVLLGIGFGFRNDLLIVIPPWIAVVLLGAPGRLRDGLRLKTACLALSAGMFVLAAAPILSAYGRGSNTGHVALLGLMNYFDSPLRVAGSIYEWGHGYSDQLVDTLVTSRTYRATGESIAYLSPEYDRAAAGYVLALARDWPADVAVRAFASVLRVLDAPFEIAVHHNAVPHGFSSPAVLDFYRWQQGVLRLLHGHGALVTLTALAILAARRPRAAVILLAGLLYFAGYPALQFHARHFFHLEFIAWGAVGLLVQQAVDAARGPAGWPAPGVMVRRVAAFAALTAAATFGSVIGLRAYQDPHVEDLIARRYLGAAREPLPTELRTAPRGRTLIALPTLWQDAAPDAAVDAAYLVAEFSNANCRSPYVTATVRYDAPVVLDDYSRVIHVRVDPGGGATTVFIPAYRRREATALAGLELANDDVGCVARVSRVAARDLPDLLLELNLAPHWRTATLHQTLRPLETADDGAGPRTSYVAAPPGAQWPSLALLQDMRANAVSFPSGPAGITPVDGGWHVATRPAAPYVYLLRFPDEVVPAASALVVEGELRSGAITIGLLKDERWAGLLNVVDAGGFVALLEQQEPGQYALVVANWAPPRWLEQYWPWLDQRLPGFLTRSSPVDVVIRRAGWVRGGTTE